MDVKSQAGYMVWFILIASFVLGAFYMIGHSVAHANKASHDREIQCLQNGGEWERVDGRYGVYCNKDD